MISQAKQLQIFALAAKGKPNNAKIAREVGCARETVRQARRRPT